MPTFAEQLYARLSPLAYGDAENDDALWKFVQAFSQPFELMNTLVRDTEDGRVGWSILFDPDIAPDEFLIWLEQMVGATGHAPESPAQMRQRIRNAEAYKRGTVQSLYDTAARAGAPTFHVEERYLGNPWAIRIFFTAAEYTPEIEYQVRSKIPAGIVVTQEFWASVLYSDVLEDYTDYADVAASNTDYSDLRGW